jgi:hypothetical protein
MSMRSGKGGRLYGSAVHCIARGFSKERTACSSPTSIRNDRSPSTPGHFLPQLSLACFHTAGCQKVDHRRPTFRTLTHHEVFATAPTPISWDYLDPAPKVKKFWRDAAKGNRAVPALGALRSRLFSHFVRMRHHERRSHRPRPRQPLRTRAWSNFQPPRR